MAEKKQRLIKGIPYEIVEDKVVLHIPDQEPVELPLELGKSAYSVAYGYLNRKTGSRRGSNGIKTVGNFTYQMSEVEEGSEELPVMTITRKNGETIEHQMTAQECKYPRTCAIKVILGAIE